MFARILFILSLNLCFKTFGQTSKFDSTFQIHGGIDYYFGTQLTDFNQELVPIYVSHNQLNSASINLALLEMSYLPTKNIRIQISPAFGSYMNANYSAEKKNLRWIYEGYVGLKPFKKRDEWIDVGVMSSPYTYEFAKSWEQPMYTRSIAPEYVPYYLLGIRYKRKLNEKLSLTTFILNGWQKLEFRRKIPSLGTQLEITDGKNYLSWTTYQGNERSVSQPDFGYRVFSDVSWIYTSAKYKIFSCIYAGIQYRSSSAYLWGQLNVGLEYKIKNELFLNSRIEHFVDPSNIQVAQVSNQGFNCSGLSLGLKYALSENLFLRTEAKVLRDNLLSGYFMKETKFQHNLPLFFLGLNLRF
jgi:hypothetical protein